MGDSEEDEASFREEVEKEEGEEEVAVVEVVFDVGDGVEGDAPCAEGETLRY